MDMVKFLSVEILGYSQFTKFDKIVKENSVYRIFYKGIQIANVHTMYKLKFDCKMDNYYYFKFESEIE